VHFCLAAQPLHAGEECLAVGANGAPQCIVIVEDCAKSKRKDGSIAEAFADYMRMFQNGLLA
jgi:hypothetical protein